MPSPNSEPSPFAPPTSASPSPKALSPWAKAGLVLAVLVGLALFVGAVVFLLQPQTPTARIRDIFLIFLALEVFLIGLALLVLVVQLAVLINLIQNELRPILESTQHTVKTVQGTTQFLSDHLIEPVLKLNEYLAMFHKVGGLLRLPLRKPPKGE